MQYLAMFAVMAMLGAGAGGATIMTADFGHGAPDDVQARNRWTGPADFGYGPCDCECPTNGTGNQYRYSHGPNDDQGNQYRYSQGPNNNSGNQCGYRWQLMADDDGDGIPNGQDDDWVPPKDGDGYEHRHGKP